MCPNRCAARCHKEYLLSRRSFLGLSASAAGAWVLGGCGSQARRLGEGGPPADSLPAMEPCGPGYRCVPAVRAAFVRRKGEYGLRWPGAVYDGQAARTMYTQKIQQTAKSLPIKVDLRPEPIYGDAEADAWIAEARQSACDGLLVVLLDRQEHAWPTANKAIATGIPTVIYSPVGTAFTTNTAAPSQKTGAVIYSTDDFAQCAYGLKMLQAGARMRAARVVVIRGGKAAESEFPQLGIKLRTVPASAFLDIYKATPESKEMLAMADWYLRAAREVSGATRQDVINGARSYMVARKILQQEQADGITMDCLGVLGPSKMSLPCLAWSRMNDDGIPAACEADLGAAASHMIVQYLFDRPGFQQDPVPETAYKAIIGAHCSCPTRLNGFAEPPEPFILRHHHAQRDATTQTLWRVGQDVTSIDVQAGGKDKPVEMIISSGKVLQNVSVPPAGGCVVSVMVRFDGVDDVLAYPGFHQVFFYGNFRRHLIDFCRLLKLQARVV